MNRKNSSREVNTKNDSDKIILKTNKLIKHAKHGSLIDTQTLLNKDIKLKKTESNIYSKRELKSIAQSRIQSPQNSIHKETLVGNSKQWKVVGIASARGLFSPCYARDDNNKVIKKTAIAKFIQAERSVQINTSKRKQEQRLKKMIKEQLDSIGELEKTNEEVKKINGVRLIASCMQKNICEKKIISANLPTAKKAQCIVGRFQKTSLNTSFKQADIQKKSERERTAFARMICSQPVSPDSSIYKPKRKINSGMNKIEKAKNELIQWILECNLLSQKIDRKKHRECPKTTQNFYIIGRVLGRGASGKVNLCIHKLSEKLVAIKSLSRQHLKSKDNSMKLQNEISALKAIKHENVIRLYETFYNEKYLLIVIELCSGGDLLSYVRKRRKLAEPIAKVAFKKVISLIIEV